PDRRRNDDAAARLVVDVRAQCVVAAIVVHPNLVSVGDAARGGIGGVHLQPRLALEVAKALHVSEARVEEIARGRRQECKWEALRERRVAADRFGGRVEERQWIHALRREERAFELALARRRG